MVNKQNLWFLTLFSLILVLSIYYLTISNDVLDKFKTSKAVSSSVEVTETDALAALKVTNEETLSSEMEALKEILLNESASVEEKNTAYEALKELNTNKGKEELLAKKIKETYNLDSIVKITADQIKVTAASKEHNTELANNIITLVQSEFKTNMFITIEFKS